jgi:hypothetical protein
MLRTTDCKIECPGTRDPWVDISMAGFCNTGQPQHCRHGSHATTLVSNRMLQESHARLPITASVDEAKSPCSHWLATDRRRNQVAGSIVFPAAMAKVCCNSIQARMLTWQYEILYTIHDMDLLGMSIEMKIRINTGNGDINTKVFRVQKF